jgi:hypothetical protein
MNYTPVLPFVATLRRLKASSAAEADERCELCRTALPKEHGHAVDVHTRRLLCVCQICGTLDGRYRAVPTRYARLPQAAFSPAEWDTLAIPVDLAFFFFNSNLGRIVACYPGPAGAAESLLPLDAWSAFVAGNPWVDALVPDVEALLVRRVDDAYTGYIVPIDACYELVGRLRRAWTGFHGGGAGQMAIDEFFAGLLDRNAAVAELARSCSHSHRKERT